MAKIILSDQSEEQEPGRIKRRLAALGIALQNWPAPRDAPVSALLAKQDLSPDEREAVLASVDDRFEDLRRRLGYKTRDLVVIHEAVPGLGDLLRRFDSVHYHEDDEVRYVLEGRGYFGFVEPDGCQFLLEVSAGDYLNVPARTEHWFEMKQSRRIKAVRYFTDTAGWVPVYTQRVRQFA
ncbi:MAG: cupin domain-containing protein [Acidiferrobacteraceae bacterium]